MAYPAHTPVKTVWIVDEGSQGHVVQSRGLVRELAKWVAVRQIEIPVGARFTSRFGRSMTKRLLRICPAKWMFRLLHPQMTLPVEHPDLIVASGPHALLALEYLAKFNGGPSVFVQGTLNVPERTVSVIVRPFEGQYRDDFVFIPLLFTEITPQVVDEAREKYFATGTRTTDEKLNVLFIGNSSAKIEFSDADWDAISRFVNSTWERDGSRWLITSSYRTGRKLEQRIRSGIRPGAVFDAVWYSEAPRKVTKEFLGMATRVFVTMDSLTMLTEGASSGRPTFALCPANPPAADANTHVRYIHQLAGQGYISLVSLSEEGKPLDFEPRKLDAEYAEAIQQLQKKIGWIT